METLGVKSCACIISCRFKLLQSLDLGIIWDFYLTDGKSKADDQAISNLELISESETSEDGCDGEEQGKQW